MTYNQELKKLQKQIDKLNSEKNNLVEILRDMVTIALKDEWDKATTGRQSVIKDARYLLKKEGIKV